MEFKGRELKMLIPYEQVEKSAQDQIMKTMQDGIVIDVVDHFKPLIVVKG